MSKDPKQCSKKDGKTFLQECFSREQVVLKSKLDLSSNSITHDGTMGEVNEDHFIDFLKEHLPKRYCVDKGIAIDSKGHTSDQIDIIIYDNQYTPILLFQKSHRYIPAEAIYAVFECKSTINKSLLEYAWDKANTVRTLHRTSVAIKHAGGTFPPGKPFPIMAGILSSNIEWADGFGKAFSKIYGTFQGARNLDCGLAVSGHYFDYFNDNSSITYGPKAQALIFFLFRLIRRLGMYGTVPAADWSSYASIMSQ